jgi:CMP-N-acetylneuraminic acid synthetase
MKVLGIIPARGGSKGVKKKNIKRVDGQPLISYTIEKAQKSKLITDLFVSTEDSEIIEVVKSYNCDFLMRSKKNAKDTTPIEAVLFESLDVVDKTYDVIMVLQPTAPIREVEDIDNVIKMFEHDEVESVVSVVELNDIHPARMYTLSKKGEMLPLNKEMERNRRQDLTPVYLRNGAIYATRVSSFVKNKKLISENKKVYVMPESKWANIDSYRDILIAEVLISEWKKGNL